MGFTFHTPAIVGGTVLVIEQIESQNYDPGVAGWAIMADGTAEFANLVARGTLIGGQVVINGTEYPNAIALYTENPSEIEPAVISPSGGVGNNGILRMESPVLFAGGAPALLELSGFDDGHTTSTLESDNATYSHDTATINGASSVLIGDGTDHIRVDGHTASVDGETWHNVTYNGNWATSGGLPVQYYRDATGRVQLRGRAAEAVALSATIATLPIGNRPSRNMSFAVKANNDAGTVCWIEVQTDGDIQILGNAAAARVQTVLDAVSFPTF
jgi:hypothetical protein